ncbi:MAG: major tail protein [Lachnotalea sp.]
MAKVKENEKTIERSRLVGLKDICVAAVETNDEDVYSAAIPVRLAKALAATIKDTFTVEYTYSDDEVEDTVETYEKTEIEVEVNRLTPGDYALLFDTLYKYGFLAKSESDKAKEVALGFRAKQGNGKYEFVWYYCGKFERPDVSYETVKDKKTVQTIKIKGTFYARKKEDLIEGENKKLFALVVDETNLVVTDTTAAEAIASWFGEVQEYVPVPVTEG